MRCFILSILITLNMCLFASAEGISLPNDELLGKLATESAQLFRASEHKEPIYPETIQLDIKHERIKGFVAKYPQDTPYDVMQKAITSLYGKERLSDQVDQGKITVWRIEKHQFAIQLSQDNDEGPQLVIVSFKKK